MENVLLTDDDITRFKTNLEKLFDEQILVRISDPYSQRLDIGHEFNLYRKKNISQFLKSRPSKEWGNEKEWEDLSPSEQQEWKSVWEANIHKVGGMIKELIEKYNKQFEDVGEGKMRTAIKEVLNTLTDDYDNYYGHIIEPHNYKFDESTKNLKNIIKESFKSIFKEAYLEEEKLGKYYIKNTDFNKNTFPDLVGKFIDVEPPSGAEYEIIKPKKESDIIGEEEEKSVVVDAIDNTDPEYIKKSLEQRNPSSQSAGSTFLTSVSIDDLKTADWQPYNHPNINSPAIAYKADIPGKLGIAELKLLPSDLRVKFQPAHKGATEGVEVVAEIPQRSLVVDHTTLILGPSKDDPNKLVVWTFFPGDPTSQSEPIMMDKVREVVGGEGDIAYGTVADAINIGFNFAKNGSIENIGESKDWKKALQTEVGCILENLFKNPVYSDDYNKATDHMNREWEMEHDEDNWYLDFDPQYDEDKKEEEEQIDNIDLEPFILNKIEKK